MTIDPATLKPCARCGGKITGKCATLYCVKCGLGVPFTPMDGLGNLVDPKTGKRLEGGSVEDESPAREAGDAPCR